MSPRLLLPTLALVVGLAGCAEPTAQDASGPGVPEPAGATSAVGRGAGGTRVQISGRWATVWASSELASDDGRYAADKAFDGDPATAWVEGVSGYGAADGGGEVAARRPLETTGGGRLGESVNVRFEEPAVFEGIALQPGFLKSARLYGRNGVPTAIEVLIDGRPVGTYELPYTMSLVFEGEGVDGPDPRPDGCYHAAVGPYSAERLILFQDPVLGTEVTVRLQRAGIGSAHEDTAVAEIRPVIQSVADPAQFIVDVLRRPLVSMTGADVLDLREVSVSAHKVVHLGPGAPRPPSSPSDEGLPRPRVTADRQDWTALETYEAEAWGHLIGTGLLVETPPTGTTVTGGVSDYEGDGEWAEVRPQLQIGPEGQLRSAREVVSFGGVPGCPGDVSRLAPISIASRTQPPTR